MSRLGPLAVLPLAALPSLAAAQDAAPAPAGTGPLTLECDAAARDAATAGHARAGKPRRSRATSDEDSGPATTSPRGGSGVRFVFEIDGDHGRVRYPAALTPVVHNGGDGGWWPIRDLVAGDDAFSGRIVLNLLNRPRFTIDRRTGDFALAGGIDPAIAGHCARASALPRLF